MITAQPIPTPTYRNLQEQYLRGAIDTKTYEDLKGRLDNHSRGYNPTTASNPTFGDVMWPTKAKFPEQFGLPPLPSGKPARPLPQNNPNNARANQTDFASWLQNSPWSGATNKGVGWEAMGKMFGSRDAVMQAAKRDYKKSQGITQEF
jgi:hypothetical protein